MAETQYDEYTSEQAVRAWARYRLDPTPKSVSGSGFNGRKGLKNSFLHPDWSAYARVERELKNFGGWCPLLAEMLMHVGHYAKDPKDFRYPAGKDARGLQLGVPSWTPEMAGWPKGRFVEASVGRFLRFLASALRANPLYELPEPAPEDPPSEVDLAVQEATEAAEKKYPARK